MRNQYFTGLKCIKCGRTYGPESDLLLCPECNNLLDPQYDYERLKADWDKLDVLRRPDNIWRFQELLPVVDFEQIVTLGEGALRF